MIASLVTSTVRAASIDDGRVSVQNACIDELKPDFKPEKSTPTWIRYATHTTGVVLGSINGIVITASGGNAQLLAPAFAKWLPLYNEIANVASTSTGRSWIYSGVRKNLIDGIAMGGIIAQSLDATTRHGVAAGALTFAVTTTLTYWFPNKYFHSIMKGIPKKLPASVRGLFEHPAGQGFIGISMIFLLERILEKAQLAAQILPTLFSFNELIIGVDPSSIFKV